MFPPTFRCNAFVPFGSTLSAKSPRQVVTTMSTPLSALFAAGGVTQLGSLRRLEHYRGKQLLEEVDAYDLLLRGIRGEPHRIENGDSLRVPGKRRSSFGRRRRG
jgi:hypothetical protein